MILRDWCDVPADDLCAAYEGERQRWRSLLQWDSAVAWQEIEHARVAWGLPGFVAIDSTGRLRGLVYYLIEHDRIDVGGLISDTDRATDVLLDGVVTVARALQLPTVRGLLLDHAVALPSSLRGHQFGIERHFYLSKPLGGADERTARGQRLWARLTEQPVPHERAETADGWRSGDADAAAALLARAYDRDGGRLFAPNNQMGEWQRYVRNLVGHVGCGTVNARLSQVIRDGDEMAALALLTDIAPGTAHLVQLAVDPSFRGERLGEALVRRACSLLQEASYQTLTLMVSENNRVARALYDRAGFRQDATFLAATLTLPEARALAS
jgi:ribosomal protein S18 acetylase RimI-like enzyme